MRVFVYRFLLNILGIPSWEISSIQLEAITGITSKVIKLIDQNKLSFFTKQQVLRMTPKTRKIYILRMQLMSNLDTSLLIKKFSGKIQYDVSINIICIVTLYFINTLKTTIN